MSNSGGISTAGWCSAPYGATLSQHDWKGLVESWQTEECCDFDREVRFFDFECNGKPFTQVALVFTPERPLVVDGRRIVIFASEAGHDSAREFAEDDCGREGPGPWLARRGVTFVATCRLGRWNFLSDDPLGSWKDVPLESRMPVFHRRQKEHWSASDFEVAEAAGISSPTGSAFYRLPRQGSALEQHMLALTPAAMMKGYRTALAGCGLLDNRAATTLLFWGFSTGGAFLWALAKSVKPDGIVAFGSANFPIAYYASRGFRDEHHWLYDSSALRVRERNYADFVFFSPDLDEQQRRAEWDRALASARFKSFEDTFMFFNVAALTESLTRLWNAGFLPADIRERGFAELVRENIDLCFPDEGLSDVRVLELSGTRDEIQPPPVVTIAASVTRHHCRAHQLLFLEGLHHSIAADQVPVFGSLWLDAIQRGYFTQGALPLASSADERPASLSLANG